MIVIVKFLTEYGLIISITKRSKYIKLLKVDYVGRHVNV